MGWAVSTDIILQPIHRLRKNKQSRLTTADNHTGTISMFVHVCVSLLSEVTSEEKEVVLLLPFWFCGGFSFWRTSLCRLLLYSHIQAVRGESRTSENHKLIQLELHFLQP